jgi:predicted aldo/keto reductase-like oxidoreductase
MLYRRFGRTELRMPVLTCGGMRYQQSWMATADVSDESQANVQAIMTRALELGITHIETARGYGTSEKQLGQILPKLPRDKIIVQTKVAPLAEPEQFENDVLDSLSRLNLPWVDLLSLHGVNDEVVLDWALRPGGCLERALALKSRGIARHIGFSSHASADVIIAAIQDGRFDYVNLHYYWAFQNNARAVRQAAARDMGVFIISPSDKGGHLYNPPPKLVELTSPYSPMVFNDLWCLSHSDVHTLSIGAQRPSDFDEHVKAVEIFNQSGLDLRSLIAPIEARLHVELERVLGKEWANTWSYGLSEWQTMPGQVNALEILRLYNMAKAFDMFEYARSRYNLLENGGHWFPGRNASEVEKLDLAPALTHSPHAQIIPKRLTEAHQLLFGAKQKRLQSEESA